MKNCTEEINDILKDTRENQNHTYLWFTYKTAQEKKTSPTSTCRLQVIQTMPEGTCRRRKIAGYY